MWQPGRRRKESFGHSPVAELDPNLHPRWPTTHECAVSQRCVPQSTGIGPEETSSESAEQVWDARCQSRRGIPPWSFTEPVVHTRRQDTVKQIHDFQ